MASVRRHGTFKDWLLGLLPTKKEIRYIPDGPHLYTSSRGFFSHAQNFTLHNPTMTSVHGDSTTVTYVQGDRSVLPQVMSLISQHIIHGAAHDSSARTPPPRCHPDTRVNLISRITAWFDGQGREELVLWITGPAGVGKSAIVQTFAERIVKLKLLGASVFFSRPNKRNNSNAVFTTVAYQLAVRIEAYRNFIAERLSLDPELLTADLQAQFNTFIIEPFVEKKIGAGGRRWGILLDGLDELEGQTPQCEIIYLITAFAREHPDAPLVWIIASRPEPHICNAFCDDDVSRSYWSECIPIDSTEACNDVERFLRSSFKMILKQFPHSLPSDWPDNTEFIQITAASSGLFVYAQVVMQFIGDPNYADPASRLKFLLSIINRSNSTPTKENPFVHLDVLYHEILSSIPSNLWPTAKQLLGFASGQGAISRDIRRRQFGTLRGMSIFLGLTSPTIYTCLIKCYSTVKIPDWKTAHKEPMGILHASFADYLKDPRRSGAFCVGNDGDIDDEMGSRLLEIWNNCSGDDDNTAENGWHRYCLKWDDKSPSRAISKFHRSLFYDVVSCLASMIYIMSKDLAETHLYAQLYKVHMVTLSYYFSAADLWWFVAALVETKVEVAGLLRRIHLKDLMFAHLDWKMMSPARGQHRQNGSGISFQAKWILHRPHSKAVLETFLSELKSLQEGSPNLEVIIFGGVPEGRVAAFRHNFKDYYIIPYPE